MTTATTGAPPRAGLRLTLARRALVEALTKAASVGPTKTTIPILTTTRLTVGEGTITLEATDLDRHVRLSVSCEVAGAPGAQVCLPTRRWLDIVQGFADDATVTLTVPGEGRRATITAGRSRAELVPMSAKEFPSLEFVDSAAARALGTLTAGALVDALRRVMHAASREASRPILNGILVHGREDGLFVVAIDGARLASVRLAATAPFRDEVILPPAAVPALKALFAASDEIELAADHGHLSVVSASGTAARFRLIEGPFPNYRQVIPTRAGGSNTLTREAIVNRLALRSAVQQLAALGDAGVQFARLAFTGTDVTVSASVNDVGAITQVLPASCGPLVGVDAPVSEAAPVKLRFDGRFLADALGFLTGEDVRLEMGHPERTVLLSDAAEPVRDAPRQAFAMIAPLRGES